LGFQKTLDVAGKLKIVKFTAIYEVGKNGLNLPSYKGSTFRGAFGHVFKKIACTCGSDEHQDNCIYQYVFETKPPQNSDVLKKYESVPRPFVIQPPLDPRTYFSPGERIQFSFTLFGKAIDYLPYFIYAFQEMGRRGLGKDQHSLQLRQVFQMNIQNDMSTLIYDGEQGKIYNRWQPIDAKDIIQHTKINVNTNRIWLYFITPTRLQKNGKYISTAPDFEDLMKATLRRLSSILYFHQEIKLEMDYNEFFSLASKIELVKSQVEWIDWERYSNRQKERIKLGGIEGKALYRGELEPFIPWLTLAGWIHIGKNPVFGLGKVKSVNN